MTECPECGVKLRNPRNCRCGWAAGAPGSSDAVHRCACELCGEDLTYPRRSQPDGRRRCIIGRTRGGGYLCGRCYEAGETFDYRDKAIADFAEKHRADDWSMLLSASRSLAGAPREDYRDFMRMLKATARKYGGLFGALPYDPTQREAA